jgi:hypothetical protein
VLFEGFGSSNKESVAELFVSLMSKVSYFNVCFKPSINDVKISSAKAHIGAAILLQNAYVFTLFSMQLH